MGLRAAVRGQGGGARQGRCGVSQMGGRVASAGLLSSMPGFADRGVLDATTLGLAALGTNLRRARLERGAACFCRLGQAKRGPTSRGLDDASEIRRRARFSGGRVDPRMQCARAYVDPDRPTLGLAALGANLRRTGLERAAVCICRLGQAKRGPTLRDPIDAGALIKRSRGAPFSPLPLWERG